jgi:hypothetical protein
LWLITLIVCYSQAQTKEEKKKKTKAKELAERSEGILTSLIPND